MSAIAVLGLGAMGARMATRLIAAGHAVTVWNRSPQATQPRHALGANVASPVGWNEPANSNTAARHRPFSRPGSMLGFTVFTANLHTFR